MHFLPDVYIQCDDCKGTRYNRETLEIKFKDKSIADVLNMSVDEGCEYFENISWLRLRPQASFLFQSGPHSGREQKSAAALSMAWT